MPPETVAPEGGLAMDALTFSAGLPGPAESFLDFPSDLAIPPDLDLDLDDLDLDIEFDPNFSLDDLLNFPEVVGDPFLTTPDGRLQADASNPGYSGVSAYQNANSIELGCGEIGALEPGVSPPHATGSNGYGSGVSSSLPSPENTGTEGFESGNSATCSSYRGCYNSGSPDSGNSTTTASASDGLKGRGLKRKGEGYSDQVNRNPNSVSKLLRLHSAGAATNSSHPSSAGAADEDDKRKARLIRNRESAQLSRQRKKLYVEELEEKVKAMNSAIADLSNRISYFMAENASLKLQLSRAPAGNSAAPPPTAMYPAVHPMAPMQYPWMPWPGYTMPPGAHAPLVPIPKLRTQQPTSTTKSRTRKKGIDSKTKKVAGVSLVGLLFFMLVLGAFVPSINSRNRGSVSTGHNYSKDGGLSQRREKVLAVSGNLEGSRFCGGNRGTGTKLEGHIETSHYGNATEPLLASLYVPRNNKLVKIDGNLIISSVVATEKAVTQKNFAVNAYQRGQISDNGDKETNLAIPGDLFSALAIVDSRRDVESLSPRFEGSAGEHIKAQEWFREGLEGPIFRSGMCTEVFQFDASLASSNDSGLVPATSFVNMPSNETTKSSSRNTRNRRILSTYPVQPARYVLNNNSNNTKKGFSEPSEGSSFSNTNREKPIIVSILVDPREGADGNVDGLLSSKSISKIFVVVLVDSVKYITYSCMLPRKSSVPHVVTV